jgi:hypothetical protein
MESLGGDLRWVDRFLGEHAAVMYYWVLVVIFMISPAASYQFMEMVEVGGWVGGRASGWVGVWVFGAWLMLDAGIVWLDYCVGLAGCFLAGGLAG